MGCQEGETKVTFRAALTVACGVIGLAGTGSVTAWAMQQAAPVDEQVYLGGATPGEQQSASGWLAATYIVLKSDGFHNNLKSLSKPYPQIWLSKYERYRTVQQLSDILKLRDTTKPGARYVPTALALIGAPDKSASSWDGYNGNKDAFTGYTGYREGGKSVGAMHIGRVHYDRYLNGNVVERSCAINTLAHEISHTLSWHATDYLEYFLDTDDASPDKPGEPVASYFIGSLAQCTYLQSQGRIKADELEACLATFGIDRFNNQRCDDFPNARTPIRPSPPSPPALRQGQKTTL
jgi:hypothetical protein